MPDEFVHDVNYQIKVSAFSVKKMVISFISLAHCNQTLVCGVWPETFKMFLYFLKLKVEISLLWKLSIVKLRNRHRSYLREIQNASSKYHEERKKEARAFVELLTYIEGSVEEGKFFLKFSELRFLYESRLKDFGISKEVNKVRFKEQILSKEVVKDHISTFQKI